MKFELWWIGKSKFDYLDKGIAEYVKRIKHYTHFDIYPVPDIKKAGSLTPGQLKKMEGEAVLKKLDDQTKLILLDERGKHYSSEDFAAFLQHQMNLSMKKIVFLIGGAYGFDTALYERADHKMALSKMTFSHQMIRLFFTEQFYRAFTIINNEKYHNS
jgi:23S rRNA (pseudouridine1915-N3)-methyltransferase